MMKKENALLHDAQTRKARDIRLDVFRGLALIIILIAHIPWNAWAPWIPARFGYSDATEMFVFLSGIASALAFGRVFDREGYAAGTLRIIRRVWVIYRVHLGIFLTIAAMLAVAGTAPTGESYIERLNLRHFFDGAAQQLPGLLTLTYVPNFFDMLPMYVVILALMPVMMAAERLHRHAPVALSVTLWLLTQRGYLDLPAEPWSDREWYFNPFGWQLLFYLGFFLMRGTLRAPAFRPGLVLATAGFVLLCLPFAWHRLRPEFAWIADTAGILDPWANKTDFGILRLMHFAALAWLCLHAAGEGGRRLSGAVAQGLAVLGRQSLQVFAGGMITAQALGIVLDVTGRTPVTTALANLGGIAVLYVIALLSSPRQTVQPRVPVAGVSAAPPMERA